MLLLGLLAALAAAGPAAAQDLAVTNARLWTGAGSEPLDDATIVIRSGRVEAIVTGGAAPADLPRLDAAGRIVTPPLFSGATQIGLMEVAGASDTADEALSAGKLGAAFDVAPAVNADSLLVARARADGLLWALSYPSGSAANPFLGQAALLRLGSDGIVSKPRAAVFARIGGSASEGAGGSRAAQWALLRTALDEAKALRAGRPLAAEERLFPGADLRALGPVLARDVPLAIQTHRRSDIEQAILLARDYRLRVVIVGGAGAWAVADALAAADVAVVLDPSANLPMSHDEIGVRLDNAAILDRAGVPIAFTMATNAIDMSYNVGVSSRLGAGLAVANGLSYGSAIRALTLGPARIWGAAPGAGTVTPGAMGDLVVWDGDPLEPASAPAALVIAGRQSDPVTRQELLTRRYLSRGSAMRATPAP